MTRLPLPSTPLIVSSLLALLAGLTLITPDAVAEAPSAPTTIDMPSLRAEYHAPNIVLRGSVPDDGERQSILRRARTIYGAGHVTDAMQVRAVANPAWLSPAFLPDLRPTLRASAELTDGGLVIEGDLQSESARQAVRASVADYLAGGVPMTDRLRVVPDARPTTTQR